MRANKYKLSRTGSQSFKNKLRHEQAECVLCLYIVRKVLNIDKKSTENDSVDAMTNIHYRGVTC